MTIQTHDEMLEEWRQKKGVTYRPDGTDSASEFWLSKLQAREQYLVGEIERLRCGDVPRRVYHKKGWSLGYDDALYDVLKLINHQESKK